MAMARCIHAAWVWSAVASSFSKTARVPVRMCRSAVSAVPAVCASAAGSRTLPAETMLHDLLDVTDLGRQRVCILNQALERRFLRCPTRSKRSYEHLHPLGWCSLCCERFRHRLHDCRLRGKGASRVLFDGGRPEKLPRQLLSRLIQVHRVLFQDFVGSALHGDLDQPADHAVGHMISQPRLCPEIAERPCGSDGKR